MTRDRGSLALELVIVTPVLLALLGLLLSIGRYASVTGLVESTTRDAARAATLSRSYDEASGRVDALVRDSLAGAPSSCRSSAVGRVLDRAFRPGDEVTVEVRCTVTYGDLGLFAVPGSTTIVRRFVSPLDPYRGVR